MSSASDSHRTELELTVDSKKDVNILRPHAGLDRRHFVKTFAFATAWSSLLGKSWTNVLAAEIAPLASTTGILRIRLQDFPALANESGSVRIGINPLRGNPPSGPLPNGTFYPVIINRGPNNTFFALNSRCTHQNCAVDPMDPSNTIVCPCHASVFAIDGRRLSGQASSNLQRYTTTFDGRDRLAIQIPSLGYTVTSSTVHPSGDKAPRLRLEFRTFRNVEYEVLFFESLDKPAVVVPFSTTLDGALDSQVFAATTATTVSLFVERKANSGFYQIAARVTEL